MSTKKALGVRRMELELNSLRSRVGHAEEWSKESWTEAQASRERLSNERVMHEETARLLKSCLGVLGAISVGSVRTIMSLGAFEDIIQRAMTQVGMVEGRPREKYQAPQAPRPRRSRTDYTDGGEEKVPA